MQNLTAEGRRIVDDAAQRHGFSSDAVYTLLMAVVAGQGWQAQFNHSELGGMGQWSQGGMIMIGDMFNNNLKYRVDSLCNELSNVVRSQTVIAPAPASFQSQSQGGFSNINTYGSSGSSLFVPSAAANWWPSDLGSPGSLGSQNTLRYAYFPNASRLAIDSNGQVTVYDTGNHSIGGFGQQQSGDQSLTFTSQYGLVRVADLPIVWPPQASAAPQRAQSAPQTQSPQQVQSPPQAPASEMPQSMPVEPAPAPFVPAQAQAQVSSDDIFAKIERLAELHQKGILSSEEFEAKKRELLSRL